MKKAYNNAPLKNVHIFLEVNINIREFFYFFKYLKSRKNLRDFHTVITLQ